jgi:vancomycin resistance protein YoaR
MLVLVSAVLLLIIAQAGRILPNTTVAGVDIGGLEPASARRILAPALERAALLPLGVSAPGERIVLRPVDAGLVLDVEASVEAAFARGRTPSLGALLARLSSPVRPVTVAPRSTVDEAALRAWIDVVADRLERDANVGSIAIDARTFAVSVRGPQGEVVIDRDATAARMRSALTDLALTQVDIAATTSLPPPTRAELEAIAQRVHDALRGSLVLHHDGRRLVIEPVQLARLLTVGPTQQAAGPIPQLQVADADVSSLLGPAGRATFDRPAVDARFVTGRTPPVALETLGSTTFAPSEVDIPIVAGVTSTAFVPARTAAQITQLVMEGRRIAEADLLEVDPELSTRAATAGRPTHLIGTFTTMHAAGADRTVNIRLLADLLDDRAIAPGEVFSINGSSGPRRCEDGFVLAGTIIRGELIDTCGGGVSQFGTTTFNAAFFAGVPLLQWQPHSFFISRYPAGREATLNYPELDVRFLNDTGGWIILRTAHTPESITVSLYGIPRWETVHAEHGAFRNPTDFTELIRQTTQLPPGVRRVIQSGGGGFTTTVSRVRTPLAVGEALHGIAQPTPIVERWTTIYRPQQRIVEVGVRPVTSEPAQP